MSGPATAGGKPIHTRQDMVDCLASGARPPAEWRIGVEHEKFPFHTDTLRPVPYQGERGIGRLLAGIVATGWTPIHEDGLLIGATMGGQSISLEPGGQLELSGAPRENLHQTCREAAAHLRLVKRIGDQLGIAFLGTGFLPLWQREDVPLMPRQRHDIMRRYMPGKGRRGLDMMLRTCTIQVNLDFCSEEDMIRKMRLSLSLQPLVMALFANSPFCGGEPAGCMSLRSQVWTDVDPDRTGFLPFVFRPDFGFGAWLDHVLSVPMYFVCRDGRHIDVAGQSFRHFLEGRLAGLPGERPTTSDFLDHLTTLFPQVRLKRFLEMRGADGGNSEAICALPAFWVGILYDPDTCLEAWERVRDWTHAERLAMARSAALHGLGGQHRGRSLRELAEEFLDLAETGLKRRNIPGGTGEQDESVFLAPLRASVGDGKCPAARLLEHYRHDWKRRVEPVYQLCRF